MISSISCFVKFLKNIIDVIFYVLKFWNWLIICKNQTLTHIHIKLIEILLIYYLFDLFILRVCVFISWSAYTCFLRYLFVFWCITSTGQMTLLFWSSTKLSWIRHDVSVSASEIHYHIKIFHETNLMIQTFII